MARNGIGSTGGKKNGDGQFFLATLLLWLVSVVFEIVFNLRTELLWVICGGCFFQLVNWVFRSWLSRDPLFVNTSVSLLHSIITSASDNVEQTEQQKIRVVIGTPLKRPPSNQIVEDPLVPMLDEVKSLGIPWVLAITNKFSVSAHQQKSAIEAVLQAYQASPNTTGIVNSIPYIISGSGSSSLPWAAVNAGNEGSVGAQKLIFAPLDLVKKPFQRKDTVFPVDGVNSLCQLVHRVLQTQEEACFQELARERQLVELAKDRAVDGSQAKSSSMSAAAVGASLGAGLGLVLAVVMGAGSALRKP